MKTLYLDAFSGMSGDMFLGALIDLGVDIHDIEAELKKLHVSGYTLTAERIAKSAIYGTNFDVVLDSGEEKDHGFIEHREQEHHGHHHGRHLDDIVKLIENSQLSETVKKHAISIFQDIGRAESKVHNVPLNEVHFHEVGALDSIVDIVGSCIAMELLGVDDVKCSTITDGTGFIDVAHGRMPVPVPAVSQMLTERTIPVKQNVNVHTELLTPTGLGIVKEFVSEFSSLDQNDDIQKIGYGFGKRDTGLFNALRVFILEKTDSHIDVSGTHDQVVQIETNIDDQTAESLGYAMDKLLANGALDAFFIPIQMKKNRPGTKLTLLVKKQDQDKLTELVFKYTTAKGVRYIPYERTIMQRSFEKITYKNMPVRIKIASFKAVKRITPEYEDCKEIADKFDLSLDTVYDNIKKRYQG
ncbi:nickel pincer cofactor biosynthesis protein LarC [Secundilactobacillus hailunensis]|uniref:Pyridinium-3,5-bisthiocarboxylic acid mononucleotide nickel insertion protein n=1 Tax=Secundilactobacillus hailunensis TaxID=2559923 RepID=A0ABW1T7P1_9LACO|nr:nickel pincer cofactor biosynthesis protein LarC [Secundilactobacillus hailunensis]